MNFTKKELQMSINILKRWSASSDQGNANKITSYYFTSIRVIEKMLKIRYYQVL